MSVEAELSRMNLSPSHRKFAQILVFSGGDVAHAREVSGIDQSSALLKNPQILQYIELLKMRRLEILAEEEDSMREAIATREEIGRRLTEALRSEEGLSVRELVSLSKVFLNDFKPASAQQASLVSIREVGRMAEEEIG